MGNSFHYQMDRKRREALIQEIGAGITVKTVEVDRRHRNGPEIHMVSSTGIISIYNRDSKKLITKLIARPRQIRRYWTEEEQPPKYLLDIAKQHQRAGWNT